MTSELWERVKQVTAAALELPADRRQEYVAMASAGDSALEQEVVSLLTATTRASALWETPAIGNAGAAWSMPRAVRPASAQAGARIGPYRLVREIGHGGMGTVFLAERADDAYRQSVAVKVAHDARSTLALERFRDERQILATLNHPNIARLMDGGTTEDGVPYLVMEFVEGVPIDEYCSARGLSITERLDLFGRVCAAVDFAHRNLVVHRDLKPRNILVGTDGPKLLDFGIATLLDPERDRMPVDRPGTDAPRMLTLEYASPEQLSGGPITTATDVYALGVVLYRLLTDRSPYRLTSGDTSELAVAVCEQELVPPSRIVGGDRRLQGRLRGDLDAIALKALEKNPAARYASAAQMAEDLERHRQRRPVTARPASLGYGAGRFLARHSLGVSAAALVLVSLAGGLAATATQVRETNRQRARAERHFDEVRRLASSLIFEVHDGIQNLPGAIPTRQLVVKRALDYVFFRLSLATALERLAENLLARRQAPEAAPLVRRAIEILRAAAAADPTDARVHFELALAYEAAGDLVANGLRFEADSDEAGQNGSAAWWYRRSVTAMEELHATGRLTGGTLNGGEAERLAEVRQKLAAVPTRGEHSVAAR